MNKKSILLTATLLSALWVSGEPLSFNFEDPKGVNHVIFMLDAPLEFISGTGTGISGLVEYDPEAPEKTNGEILLSTDSLEVTNPKMSKTMKGKKWLNAKVNESIRFSFESIEVESVNGPTIAGSVTGTLEFLGVSKEITAPVKITHVEGGASDRGAADGDLLVVRADFNLKLDEFGLKMNAATRLKVDNEPDIKVVIAGYPKN